MPEPVELLSDHTTLRLGGPADRWVRATTEDELDSFPVWSPDDAHIAFRSDRDGNLEVFIMEADGTDAFNRTLNLSVDCHPDWTDAAAAAAVWPATRAERTAPQPLVRAPKVSASAGRVERGCVR